MKSYNRCLFFSLLSATVLLGCETIPKQTALTPAILERMKKLEDYNMHNYYFILSGPIILNTVKDKASIQTSTPPKIRKFERRENVNAGILFKDTILYQNIMLRKNIKGDYVDLKESGDELLLRIYFEGEGNETNSPSSTLYLVFAAKKSDMNSFFYLKYNPGPGRNHLSKEKGTLKYNGETYDVLFDGVTPYLLIWLDQILDAEVETREIRGRLINSKY